VTTVNDTRQLLRETRDRVIPPSDVLGSLDRRRRHDTQIRRATAAVLGILVALAGLGGWFAIRGETPNRTAGNDEQLGIFAPVAGWIFYANDPNGFGRSRIRAVDPASSGEYPTSVQVTSQLGAPLGWSSDGTELLIRRSLEDGNNRQVSILILHADGTESEVVRQSGMVNASISPDGSRVAYTRYESPGLYLVDADGGPHVLLAEAGGAILDEPTFSPDGTQIAYVEMIGEWPRLEQRVWIVNADGSDAHVIVENAVTLKPGLMGGLAWSPRGDRIAMGLARLSDANKFTFAGIYSFSPNGSRFRLVIEDGVSPTWSPDGSRIAFEGALSTDGITPSRLMIADADGSDRQDLNLSAVGPGLWHPGD
jgi:Tol biopolymer transport system component